MLFHQLDVNNDFKNFQFIFKFNLNFISIKLSHNYIRVGIFKLFMIVHLSSLDQNHKLSWRSKNKLILMIKRALLNRIMDNIINQLMGSNYTGSQIPNKSFIPDAHWSSLTNYYQLVIVNSLSLSQSDPIKGLLLSFV
jgi:hypothetical protein